MKKIHLILALLLMLSCTAQRIIPIQNYGQIKDRDILPTDYFKDTDNILDPYVGTWVYTNGTTSLKFILKKEVNNNNGYYIEDVLYGEYEYIENGILKISTLSKINTVYRGQVNHTIGGNRVLNKNARQLGCPTCAANEKRLLLSIGDDLKGTSGRLFLRLVTVNGRPALESLIQFSGLNETIDLVHAQYTSTFVGSTVPNGRYTLIKQP